MHQKDFEVIYTILILFIIFSDLSIIIFIFLKFLYKNTPTFLIRKVGKRIFHRTHHFISAKFLKFQETFYKKFLVSGFGADAPTYLSYKKGKPKNFPPTTPLYFGETFKIPKDFSRKALWSGFGADAPT